MKYEVPVCEMIKLYVDDVITTSIGAGEVPSFGDTPDESIDNTTGGIAL